MFPGPEDCALPVWHFKAVQTDECRFNNLVFAEEFPWNVREQRTSLCNLAILSALAEVSRKGLAKEDPSWDVVFCPMEVFSVAFRVPRHPLAFGVALPAICNTLELLPKIEHDHGVDQAALFCNNCLQALEPVDPFRRAGTRGECLPCMLLL